MNEQKKWEQIYMQKPEMDEEYKIVFDLWCKYFRQTEQYDRMIAPSGFPRTSDEKNLMNKNAIETLKKMGLLFSATNKRIREYALKTVEREFLAGAVKGGEYEKFYRRRKQKTNI